MSRTPMYDPLTSDARSSWLAGLTEACNKLSGVLDMKVQTFTNLTLPELYIEENDRFRIYQAPLGNKLWLTEPAPVIKKNGTVITPENDGFTIDYLGGSIVFESSYVLTEWDVITADASYIVDESNKISSILASIDTIEEEAGKNKGAFNTVSDLEGAYPNASAGDFAIVSSENAIYIWDDTAKEWVNANAKVDLTSYFTKTEINALLDEKQDTILAKEIPSGSSESATDYFYSGNKTWVSLIAKIKGCALSGLVTSDDSQVEEADTLLEAIGKLQAQINSFIHPIVGNSAPTTSTVGIVGQDYINKSNGDKYRLISIEGSGTSKTYIWQKYGATSVTNFAISIPSSAWSNKSCTISNSNIQSGTEYTYFVGPSDSSYKDYNECGIYADDITTNGSITFHVSETPTVSISVDICKMSGSTNGGKVYNSGGTKPYEYINAIMANELVKSSATLMFSMGIPMSQTGEQGEPHYDVRFEPSYISVNGLQVAKKGADCADGKSAYQYAVDGGYTGTETQFQSLMGTGPWLPLSGDKMGGDIDMNQKSLSEVYRINFVPSGLSVNSVAWGISLKSNKLLQTISWSKLPNIGHSPEHIPIEVGEPTTDDCATTKKYVDDSIKAAITDSWSAAY